MNIIRYTTALSEDDFFSSLQKEVTHHDEFRLISYLSPGGVVVRGISPPDNCETRFFGIIKEQKFSIVENTEKRFVSPYQPILHGKVEEGTITLSPQMHPQAYPLLWLYTVFGGILIVLGIVISREDSFIFSLSLFFGIILIVFPRYRTKMHFEACLKTALTSFENLPIEIEKNQS